MFNISRYMYHLNVGKCLFLRFLVTRYHFNIMCLDNYDQLWNGKPHVIWKKNDIHLSKYQCETRFISFLLISPKE